MPYREDELRPISALQHLRFCPRQCALIHLEQVWAENRLTAEGRVLHEKAHEPRHETRAGVRVTRSLHLCSFSLGLSGMADIVEFHPDGAILPVEYKRGKPKADGSDALQLCAQALCLEEMLARPVPAGALFYGQTRRRQDIVFDKSLRDETAAAARDLRASPPRRRPSVVRPPAPPRPRPAPRVKKHLNTLFVTTDGSYLLKDGEAVVVRFENQTRLRVPLHNLDGIVTLGWDIGCSPQLMAACAQAGVTLSFCDPRGRFMAAINGYSPGNVLLRRAQYRHADDTAGGALAIAKNCVAAKIANSRQVVLRAARDHASPATDRASALATAAAHLAHRAEAALATADLDALRGVEGDAADTYFQVFNHLLTLDTPSLLFTTRSRRPPLDPINALLSFLYSLLAHDVRSACESTGLDAAVGFLHRDRPGRPGLALDLMEELRPVLADRLALSLFNRKQLGETDFVREPSGAVLLKEDSRKTVLLAWQQRKQDELTHPFTDEKITLGLLPHLQARLLARTLRGDLDAYPAFLWR